MAQPANRGGGSCVATVVHDGASFDKLVLTHPSGQSSAEIYLHGATLTSWRMAGQEMLYLSPKAIFASGKAIRGGVPIVFPQFGPGALPQHGFARNSLWKQGTTSVVKGSGDLSSELILEDNEETRAVWPNAFRLTLTVVLKLTSLSMQLRVQNNNADGRAFTFTALLHTYLRVSDISTTVVRGLSGKQYVDQLDGNAEKTQSGDVRFEGEVDRKYKQVNTAHINDGGNCEVLLKTSGGFSDMVVWNPHVAKSAGMKDLPPDDWRKFVCVEAGCVCEPVSIDAHKSWEAAQGLSLALLPEAQKEITEKATQPQQQQKL